MRSFLSRTSSALGIVAVLAPALVSLLACSSSSPPDAIPSGDGGAGPDGATVVAVAPGQLAIRVNQASVVKSRDAKSGVWSQTMAYLSITLANGAGGADVPANFALFTVKTSGGISKLVTSDAPFTVDDQTYSAKAFLSDPACDPSLSISGGASLTCTIAVSFDGDVVPTEVTYRTPGALADANGVATNTSDKRTATAPFTASACTPCGNICTDLAADSHNCGTCGIPAPSSGACVHGVATCGDAKNPNLCTRVDHTAYCTSFLTSSTDCGACGVALPSSTSIECVAGHPTCVLASDQLCPAKSGSSPYCASLDNDSQNCGACGHVVTGSCVHGQVSCPTSEPDACTNAQGNTVCTNTLDDYQNCGTCGHACGSGFSCSSGSCL